MRAPRADDLWPAALRDATLRAMRGVLGDEFDPDLAAALRRVGTALLGEADPASAARTLGTRLEYLGHRPRTLVNLLLALARELAVDPSSPSLEEALASAADQLFTTRDQELVRLAVVSTRDPLTSLPNRRAFSEALERAHARVRRGSTRAWLIAIDVDNFKEVNDTFGHRRGDEVMAEMAVRLAKATRTADLLARTGGDEFSLLVEPATPAQVASLLLRLEVELARPLASLDGARLAASAGVAELTSDADDVRAIVDAADRALYRAKRSGQSERALRVAWAGPEDEQAKAPARLTDALFVEYQPIVDLTTGRTVRAEALARLGDATGPRSFETVVATLTMAERIELHRAIVARVLADLRTAGPDAHASVNLDADVLNDEPLVSLLREGLTALAPDQLRIEITERSVLLSAHLEALRRLRTSGATLSLDDFGTGYASLSRLTAMPIAELKLDRSLLGRRSVGAIGAAIIAIAVALCRALDLELVVEGADSLALAAELRAIGVRFAQGFALGMPSDSLEKALAVAVSTTDLDRALGDREVALARAAMWEQGVLCLLASEPPATPATCALLDQLGEPERSTHLAHHRILEALVRDGGVIDLRDVASPPRIIGPNEPPEAAVEAENR